MEDQPDSRDSRSHQEIFSAANLAESEFLSVVTDRLPVRVAYLDPDMRYVFLNGEYERQFGFAPREAWGRTVEEIAGTPAWLAAKPYLERALAGESSTQEITLPYVFGTRRIEARFVSDIGSDGTVRGVVVHAIDVTARYEAEKERDRLDRELRVEREKLQTIFEHAPSFLALLRGREFEFEYVNEAYIGLVGQRDLVGKTVLQAIPEVANQGFLEILSGVMDTGQQFIGQGMPILLRRTLGEPPKRHFLDFVYQPIRDVNGNVTGILAHGVDVTDRYQMEMQIRELNEDLEARVKERTLELQDAIRESEGFNYSVAHDLRSPLRAIVSTANILQWELGDKLGAHHKELLERQTFNATRISRLIDELLRLSRLSRVEVMRKPIDMTEMAQSVALELDASRKLEVQSAMTTNADPELVRTILQNLVSNAFKFSASDSQVTVGETDGAFWVQDQGVGFDMQFSLMVFRPFERLVTEAEFEGTGIGLANVDRIVRRHKGRVWAESEPGVGSTFYFTLNDRNA